MDSETPQDACLPDIYYLYVFPFSLYSIMARLTYAFGQTETKPNSERRGEQMRLVNKLVNLHRNENIAEQYLLSINPKGQVCCIDTLTHCVLCHVV